MSLSRSAIRLLRNKCNPAATRSPIICTTRNPWQSSYLFTSHSSVVAFSKARATSSRQNIRHPGQIRTMATSEPSSERGTDSVPDSAPERSAQPKLPPLSDHDFRQYNRLAEHMDLFHNHFRSTWNMLWGACTSGKRPAGMSLKAFIGAGLQFVQHLEMHHGIEESYVFPVLAKKMPEFRSGKGNGAAELLRQHKEIHKGLETLQNYLRACKSGETELELSVLKTKMEDWGTVLWTHLDQEVRTLGAENMRKYWTLEEMRGLQM